VAARVHHGATRAATTCSSTQDSNHVAHPPGLGHADPPGVGAQDNIIFTPGTISSPPSMFPALQRGPGDRPDWSAPRTMPGSGATLETVSERRFTPLTGQPHQPGGVHSRGSDHAARRSTQAAGRPEPPEQEKIREQFLTASSTAPLSPVAGPLPRVPSRRHPPSERNSGW